MALLVVRSAAANLSLHVVEACLTTRSNGAEVLGCDVASGQGNEDQNSAHFGGRLSILVGWICPLA